jgi:hypothetical protein
VDRDQSSQETGTRTASAEHKASPPRPGSGAKKGTPPRGKAEPAKGTPDIMSKLPKSRPQRTSDRRRATARRTPARPATTPRPGKATTAAKRPATPRPRTTTGAARAPVGKTATEPRPAASRERPPSLPRLAIDGATEAAKLPLKVSGRLTLKALDAVARGLRGR